MKTSTLVNPVLGVTKQENAQTRAMPNRWINCDCGWGWALRKDVKEGWSTHCECCGRKWEKLLAKRQMPNPASARQVYNTQEDWHRWEAQAWEQTTRKPKKQPAWPPGLGWGRSQLTPGEYEDAVASLWKDADPQAQQVLRACGIEPPNDEEPDPRTVLHRYLARYKSITQQHRSLVAKKAQLQIRADKVKAQFEKLVQDLADVSKEIEQAESHLVTVQTQVQTQLKEAEPPKVQDLQGLLKNAGVTLTDDQHVALSAYIQTMTQPKIDEEMLDLGEGWLRESFPPDMFRLNRAESGQDTNPGFGPSRTSRAGQRSTPLSRGEQEES